jgi:3-hydroxyisobutyrate dehydrogenase-like beta-hydroxyacid dehydrogenase
MGQAAMGLRFAFIGIGTMGEPIARRLLHAGEGLSVYDVRPQALERLLGEGALRTQSSAQAASAADMLFTCLPDESALEAVYFGPGGLLEANDVPRIVIDLSTSGPEMARRIGGRLQTRDVSFIDAPVSGGAQAAETGTLTVIVSGQRSAIDTAMSALQSFGRDVFVVGNEAGQAQVVKLINNVLSYAALAISSEALVVGCKAGIDVEAMVRALNKGTARNSAIDTKIPRSVLSRRFDFGASNRISRKDLSLYLDLARRLDVATPVAGLLFSLLQMWMREREDEDMTSIARLFEGWAGVQLGTGERQ